MLVHEFFQFVPAILIEKRSLIHILFTKKKKVLNSGNRFADADCFVFGLGDSDVGELHEGLAAAGGHDAGISNVSEAALSPIGSQDHAFENLRNNFVAQ